MTDPFNKRSDARKFFREAQVGLLVIALMLVFFAYVAYYRIEEYKSQLPQYVIDAPVAKLVDPETYLREIPEKHLTTEPAGQQVAQMSPVTKTPMQFKSPAAKVPNKPISAGSPDPLTSHTADAKARLDPDRSPPTEPADPIYDNRLRSAVVLENKSMVESKVVTATQFEPVLTRASRRSAGHNPAAYDIAEKVTFSPQKLFPVPTDDSTLDELVNMAVSNDNGFQPNRRQSSQMNPDTADVQLPEPDEFTKSVAGSASGLNDGAQTLAAQPSTAIQSDIPKPASGTAQPTETKSTLQDEIPADENVEPVNSANTMAVNHRDGDVQLATKLSTHPPGKYTVNPGDSYWSIAQELYDDGRFFRALFEHNRSRLINFENLDAGTELNAPAADILILRYPDLCPPDKVDSRAAKETANLGSSSVYETRQGDTLFDVARKQLGQASRYLEILQLNNQQLPSNVNHLSKLRAGIKLDMPQ